MKNLKPAKPGEDRHEVSVQAGYQTRPMYPFDNVPIKNVQEDQYMMHLIRAKGVIATSRPG